MEDRTYKRIWLAVLVLSMVAAGSAKGRTITVGLDAGYDFGTIQSAIDDSNDGDVVLVDDGRYTGPGNYEIDFMGKAITLKSQNGPEVTIVDAQDQGGCFCLETHSPGGYVLEGFTITGANAGCGSGIYCGSTSPKIFNCIITGNKGDGITCSRVTEIIDCIITNNSSNGIRCGGGSKITNCAITDNSAAGIESFHGSAEITNCIIAGNARGIDCMNSGPIITNCLIASNHNQGNGGGIEATRGNLTVSNCTITDNSCDGSGGGIFFERGLRVRNCIVWGNSDSNGTNEFSQIYDYNNDGTIFVNYSCIQGWSGYWSGIGNIGYDPSFVDPDNSEPNKRDFRVLADSPCIDAGADTWPVPLPTTDLDGNFRQIDGDNDGVVVVDMGAYEYGTVETPLIYAKPDHSEFVYRMDGPNPDPQILYVRNIGTDTLNWQITEDCSWLQTEPTSGSSVGEVNEVNLIVDAAGLPAGRHVCELTISDQAAGNSPVTVSAATVVYAQGWLHVPEEFLTIQAAIDAAHSGDTVIVADGTYRGDGNRDINFTKPITVRSENGPENCIIDCQGTHVLKHRGFFLGGDPNTILDGFTITNGYHDDGGAIYIAYFVRPVITNCIIKGNTAGDEGGGIHIASYACAKLTNCVFSENTAGNSGGAMSTQGRVIAINSTFTSNSAGKGGGIYDLYGYPTFINCTLSGNRADLGGGLYTHESHSKLTNCNIIGNIAKIGGGIYFDDDTKLTCTNCIFWANSDSKGTGEQSQIWATDTIYINQCCIQGWAGGYGEVSGTGNIGDDPCFAEEGYWDANETPADANDDFWVDGDYHLKSQAGRWDANEERWTKDDVTSPCIDTGNPMGPIGPEPFPNGGIINIGAYGGTAEASKSYFDKPPCETIVAGDVNGDCEINFKDFTFLCLHWLIDYEQFDCPECPFIED